MVLFHAGTAVKKSGSDEDVLTSGGRVIAVVGMAQTIHDAQKTAYQSIKKITFDGMQYRTDIAARACRYAINTKQVCSLSDYYSTSSVSCFW